MAMIIRVTKTLSNNRYTSTISLESIDSVDAELMSDFGEPTIDFGGAFAPPEAGITSTFTIPANVRPIKSGLPQQIIREGGTAKTEANDWATVIVARLLAKIQNLRLETDDFSGTTTSSL